MKWFIDLMTKENLFLEDHEIAHVKTLILQLEIIQSFFINERSLLWLS